MNTTQQIESIARVCHEANRAFCETLGDTSQKSWNEAEAWQRDSALKGVMFAIQNPTAPPSSQHDEWLATKKADGWKYGPVKNPALREHPCMVPYDHLPVEQRKKDMLFKAIVSALI